MKLVVCENRELACAATLSFIPQDDGRFVGTLMFDGAELSAMGESRDDCARQLLDRLSELRNALVGVRLQLWADDQEGARIEVPRS